MSAPHRASRPQMHKVLISSLFNLPAPFTLPVVPIFCPEGTSPVPSGFTAASCAMLHCSNLPASCYCCSSLSSSPLPPPLHLPAVYLSCHHCTLPTSPRCWCNLPAREASLGVWLGFLPLQACRSGRGGSTGSAALFAAAWLAPPSGHLTPLGLQPAVSAAPLVAAICGTVGQGSRAAL